MNCFKIQTNNNCINFYIVLLYFLLIMSFLFSILSLSLNIYSLYLHDIEEDEIVIDNIILE
jgi:hypothetical protein